MEVPFSREYQKNLINQILEDEDIGDHAKALTLRRKIKENHFDKEFVSLHLDSKQATIIKSYLLDLEWLIQEIPQPHSASDWSQQELDYYNVQFVEVSFKEMFGLDYENVKLPANIQSFLEEHSDSFLSEYAKNMLGQNIKGSNFANHFCFYKRRMLDEPRVDNTISCFVNKIFGKEFNVEIQVKFPLQVNMKIDCVAITDVLISDFCQEEPNQIAVIEDKTGDEKKLKAQVVAEAISIAQFI